MPETDQSAYSRVLEACKTAKRETKPNLSKIAREYGVPRRTLYDHVKKGVRPRPPKAKTDQSGPEVDQPVPEIDLDQPAESRMIAACEAAKREQKPNLSKIARDYGVPRRTLYDHVKKGVRPRPPKANANRSLPEIDQPVSDPDQSMPETNQSVSESNRSVPEPDQPVPRTDQSAESLMIEACEAARREENPNLSKIARQYRVPRRTLYNRVKKGVRPRPPKAKTDQSVPEVDQPVPEIDLDQPAESRMIAACEAAKREQKPNLSKIARQYRVSHRTLYNRVKKGVRPRQTIAKANQPAPEIDQPVSDPDQPVPEIDQPAETRLNAACEAARREKEPNLSRIARQYRVHHRTLYDRFKKGVRSLTGNRNARRILDSVQEETLTGWIRHLIEWDMPPTPKLIESMANSSLARNGRPEQRVSKMWAYRFIRRLPPDLQQGIVMHRTHELDLSEAEEDAELLADWFKRLKDAFEGVPARLIYNFDECGFWAAEDRNQNEVDSQDGSRSGPDLAETERGGNITAFECVSADGWQLEPLYIFKRDGELVDAWFDDGSVWFDYLPPVGIPPNGWNSDELATQWLDCFIESTSIRTEPGEKRVLIVDRRAPYITVEFIRKCEDNDIIPFAFGSATRPLDGKPFMRYKEHFQSLNNDPAYWAGGPMGRDRKAQFLRAIGDVRWRAIGPRTIQRSFKDSGVYPFDASKLYSRLSDGCDEIPDPVVSAV
ncbi:transposase [Penicillium bovifimosum]|uniref:Transposase n=1 Tax=Penicillium bovifimosum TaxID=126998 RepID=A0A9W9HC11_9EURO|nr:transposase [Penicillium bovifimosum]KAJ5143674.1 transposase [Penicillium bovifimosum]